MFRYRERRKRAAQVCPGSIEETQGYRDFSTTIGPATKHDWAAIVADIHRHTSSDDWLSGAVDHLYGHRDYRLVFEVMPLDLAADSLRGTIWL